MEWTNDLYEAIGHYTLPPVTDPMGPSASSGGFMVRGGSWRTSEDYLKSGYRFNAYADYAVATGIRLCRTVNLPNIWTE
jgi:formylglycine-generating enzyme required for sulfatase activity